MVHKQGDAPGQSITPTGKEPVHNPNRQGDVQKACMRGPHQKWPKKMPGAHSPLKHERRHKPFVGSHLA